ncbi:MAG: hypothetical protein EXX96DRAFT_545372 [Benjaminiella poitrasii]|nr:MAG: hypothetical protein EXX96DRAFT_545372 [Benjaminiella poitrasii]
MSTTIIPWETVLKDSYHTNYDDDPSCSVIYLSMSSLKRSGELSMHCIPFHGFLKDDVRFLKFSLAMNDNLLMGDIKSNPKARLNWMMPKSKEYYNFKGKFYIASAPIQVTRFPPPKISDDIDYWENQRIKEWREMSSKARATFTWPSRGELPKAADIVFSCQSLSGDENSVVYDIAMDNFCLLVYKVSDVEHFDYSCYPPKRTVYTVSAKDYQWTVEKANP